MEMRPSLPLFRQAGPHPHPVLAGAWHTSGLPTSSHVPPWLPQISLPCKTICTPHLPTKVAGSASAGASGYNGKHCWPVGGTGGEGGYSELGCHSVTGASPSPRSVSADRKEGFQRAYENKGGVYTPLVSVWEDEGVLEVGDSGSYTTCV